MINLINVEEPLQNALKIIGWYCKHNDCKTCGLNINSDTCITDKDPDTWWMYLNAERKTENSSEIPNNCEPKICDTCRYYNSNIPCGSTPSACKEADKFAKEFVDGLKKLQLQTDEFFREPTAEERKAVADYIDSISVPTGVNVFDLMYEPHTERNE